MKRARTVLTPILACVVSLASFSCACAAPVPEPATAPAPQVHHHDHGGAEQPDCAESGCGGNGGFDAVMPPAGKAIADVQDTPVGDDAPIAPVNAFPPYSHAVFPAPQAPPDPRRAGSTPVSRFDRLLN